VFNTMTGTGYPNGQDYDYYLLIRNERNYEYRHGI